ncbi:MAG: glycosyltransferase, partial [Faecousia sp.]
PSDEEYVQYSFPSKTMEYMSTGTPVLTTALPCIPEEYHPHLYFIGEETPQGIAEALSRVLSHSDAELFAKGCQARRFVLEQRNNVVQAAKVLEMLGGMD